ncbi:hypothetical protein HYX12_01550 [Candidatus Woesearchaeota archaeon]|nr:hypothetical protein [Candidatus Woesearchaeota archaeon]
MAAVFSLEAKVSDDSSFAEIVDIALLAGKFNERAIRDYHLLVQPDEIIVR